MKKVRFPLLNALLPGIFIFLFLNISSVYAQGEAVLEETFSDGEYFLAYGDYSESLHYFKKVYIRGNKDNANINYRIGLCMIKIDGKKTEAIPYLEKAVEDITLEYREGDYAETKAPIDAYFHLGRAYHVNNELDKAIGAYKKYLEYLPKDDELGKQYTTKEIDACKVAKEFMSNPVDIELHNVGQRINNGMTNFRPVVSGNDSVIVYMNELKFYDAIFTARRESDGEWSFPLNITPQVKSDGDLYVVSLSDSGKTLIMSRDDGYTSDLFISTYEDGKWTSHRKMDRKINSRYWESHGCLSPDGNALYFSSNRGGGHGNSDIYYIEKKSNGKWDKPVNLGSVINTPYNEEAPFITSDGKTLIFASEGHKNMGGFDIFYSKKNGDEWSNPVNMGYGINTTDDDNFLVPVIQGKYGYIAKIIEDGFGNYDIYRVELPVK
jgi:hypothetical protein